MGDVDVSLLTGWVREFARVIGENAQFLTDLDAAIGDADHGINMDRGMKAVLEALDSREEEAPAADMAALCKQVGMTMVKSVCGASGPLYGTFFLRMGGRVGGRRVGGGRERRGGGLRESVARRFLGCRAAWSGRIRRQGHVRRTGAGSR